MYLVKIILFSSFLFVFGLRLICLALLRFSQTCELLSSKAAFLVAFFAAVNHNYKTDRNPPITNHKP